MTATNTEYLFVYGTLRSGCASPLQSVLARHARFVSMASIQGRLYDLGTYPGLVESTDPAEQVTGEIVSLSRPLVLLKHLDAYEGCGPRDVRPHEYLRRKRLIDVKTGLNARGKILAWVYLYNWPISPQMRILSGDYLAP